RNHSWSAKAYDAAGNNKVSGAVSLTVNIPVPDNTLTIEAEDMSIKTTGVPITGGWNIRGNGYIADDIDFAAGGTFSFKVIAMGSYAGGAWPIMEVRIDQTPVGTVTVDSSSWTGYTIQANIKPGTYEVAIAFINDYWKAPADRNLYVDKVTITTENSPPVADAGDDQTVEEGDVVVLDGFNSSDPDDNITGYYWEQTDDGVKVDLTNPGEAEATFIAPVVGTEPEMFNFKLIVIDAEGLESTDTCSVQVTKAVSEDRDGDGYPDDEDAFPDDPDEHLDTDRDGIGNNKDEDDDGDFMPDTWELKYGLDPLKWDADDDPDGDGVSNYDEYYYFGTDPNHNKDNFEPYPPVLIAPEDHEVSLTPLLETEEFDDPNINDVHLQTQWEIRRAEDEFEDEYIVFDVTTESSLTSLTVPKMILEYDTKYIWRVKFIDNYGGASDWSEAGYFRTEFSQQDSDGNGILDHQEVGDTLDLDNDGVPDREQPDIKCIVANSGNAQIGVSIRDAENVDSILSLEIEETENADLVSNSKGKPRFIDFGLLHFKLLLNAPGEETVVTIHLSDAPFGKGKKNKRERVKMYKYDPVNTEWLDYSQYAEFSSDRKKVYLTLKDGGFGDADGIENGIIVDPLAFGSDSDSNSDSGSGSDSDDSLIPDNVSCFITAASSDAGNIQPLCNWREIGRRELLIVFCLMVLGCVGTEIFLRFRQKRGDGDKSLGRIAL
ncbi:MAG: carbohydrate-binding domain-containing protein, partial [Desulfobacterales bacterium]